MDEQDSHHRRIGSYALTAHDGARTIMIRREDGLTGNMKINLQDMTIESLSTVINNLQPTMQKILDMLQEKQILARPQRLDPNSLGDGTSLNTLYVVDDSGKNHAIGNFDCDNKLIKEAIEGDWAILVSYLETSRQVAGVERLLGAKIKGLSTLRSTMARMEQFRILSVIKEHQLRVSGKQSLRSTLGSTRHFSTR